MKKKRIVSHGNSKCPSCSSYDTCFLEKIKGNKKGDMFWRDEYKCYNCQCYWVLE